MKNPCGSVYFSSMYLKDLERTGKCECVHEYMKPFDFSCTCKFICINVTWHKQLASYILYDMLVVIVCRSFFKIRIAMHATLAAREFFLANFYPPSPFNCIYTPTPSFSLLAWLKPVHVWARRIKQVTLLVVTDNWCTLPCSVPAECKLVPKYVFLFFWFGILKLWAQFWLSERDWCVL